MIIFITFLIIITVIIVTVLLINKKNQSIEGYDERLPNTNFEKCAEFCKTTAGCYGFGYDKEKDICYPSKETIAGRPLDPKILYKEDYQKSNATCNKLQPIRNPQVGIPFSDRRANSIFVCTEEDGFQPQWYLHYNKTFRNIGEGKNIDQIFDVDEYNVKAYTWPTNKFDLNHLDYLLEQRDKEILNPDNITSVERIENPLPERVVQSEELPPTPVNRVRQLDFNLNQVIDKGTEILRNVRNSLILPAVDATVINPELVFLPERHSMINKPQVPFDHTYTEFRTFEDMNDGDFLNRYQCVANISKKNCLKYCSDSPACVGVEYNPIFGERRNVCCPKRSIGTFKPRSDEYRNGRFYLKQVKDKLDKSNLFISIPNAV